MIQSDLKPNEFYSYTKQWNFNELPFLTDNAFGRRKITQNSNGKRQQQPTDSLAILLIKSHKFTCQQHGKAHHAKTKHEGRTNRGVCVKLKDRTNELSLSEQCVADYESKANKSSAATILEQQQKWMNGTERTTNTV